MRTLALVLAAAILLGGLALAPPAAATHEPEAITVEDVESAFYHEHFTTWPDTISETITISPPLESVTNGLLIVGVSLQQTTGDTTTVDDVQLDGISLTLLRHHPGDNVDFAELWFIRSPTVGLATITIVFNPGPTYDSSLDHWEAAAGAIYLSNVHPDDPFRTNVFGSTTEVNGGGSSTSPVSVDLTSRQFSADGSIGDLVVSLLSGSGGSATPGNGETSRWTQIGVHAVAAGMATQTATQALMNMEWTLGAPVGSNNFVLAVSVQPTLAADIGGGGDGVPPGPPAPPPDLKFRCDALSDADWLLPATQPGSRTVTLYDFRSEAVLVVEYLIAWGDGKSSIVGKLPVNHTYAKEGVYLITMRLALRTGEVQIFVTRADLRSNNCALQMFAQDFFGPLIALAALALVVAVVLTAKSFGYRLDPRKRGTRRVQKGLLGMALISFGLVLAIAVYAAIIGTPI